jgi:prepilin-type processing-associated H-X9-DG protein/prepilin-type N-terminal cleavage/methylation domain-containing protein
MLTRMRKAFTLVELLVVVGVVAVLIALLMPALSKVRRQAKTVKCAANLRSIGQALTMYTQQYGYYPACYYEDVAIWPPRLRAFTNGEERVFNCPAQDEESEWKERRAGVGDRSASGVFLNFGYAEAEAMITTNTRFSYGYNVWGASQGGSNLADHKGLGFNLYNWPANPTAREIRASRIKVPSLMIAIADSRADGHGDIAISPRLPPSPWVVGDEHQRGANVLFCDGHVQWYLRQELLDEGPLRREVQRMWNSDHLPNP